MLSIYVDGGVISRNPSPYGGTYAYRIIDEDGSVMSEGCKLSTSPLPFSNNMAEYLAALYGMSQAPANVPITLFSDSQITIGRISLNWRTEGIPGQWVERMKYEKERLKRFLLCELLDGHPNKTQLLFGTGKRGNKCSIHNVYVDKMCQRKSKEYLESINQIRT